MAALPMNSHSAEQIRNTFSLRRGYKLILVIFAVAGSLADAAVAQDGKEPVGTVVNDTVLTGKVLKAVRSHVLSVTKDRRKPIVIREKKKTRRFIVMGFMETVTRNKSGYTAQIDVDEYDHKIPRILYVDLKSIKGKFKVTKIRIGPNHFRDDDKTQRGRE